MQRYAEEYDVAIVGGGPDILFFYEFLSSCSLFKRYLESLTTVYLVFQLPSN